MNIIDAQFEKVREYIEIKEKTQSLIISQSRGEYKTILL